MSVNQGMMGVNGQTYLGSIALFDWSRRVDTWVGLTGGSIVKYPLSVASVKTEILVVLLRFFHHIVCRSSTMGDHVTRGFN